MRHRLLLRAGASTRSNMGTALLSLVANRFQPRLSYRAAVALPYSSPKLGPGRQRKKQEIATERRQCVRHPKGPEPRRHHQPLTRRHLADGHLQGVSRRMREDRRLKCPTA